jgi:hypothetical protein
VAHVIGRVNFLSAPHQSPHLPIADMAKLLRVKQQTMADKGRLIMDMLRISALDTDWFRQEMIEKSPLIWLVQINACCRTCERFRWRSRSMLPGRA